MSVLVLMPHWPGPSELWLRRMIDAIEEDVCAIATFSPPMSKWNERIPVIDLTPKAIRFAARAKIKWLPGLGDRALVEVLEHFGVKSVFCHYLNFAVGFKNVWNSTNIPLHIHCHGYDITWDYRSALFPLVRRFRRGYKGKAIRLATRSHLIVNSEMAKARLVADGFCEDRIIVKYIGVPVSAEPPMIHTASKEINILYLGRLVDCKGPDLTVLAFDHACKNGLDARLTIAGDGTLYKECLRLKQASPFGNRITLLGAVDARTGEVLRKNADVFTAHNCFGRRTKQVESYGVSVVEAMAAGLPVVTGRSGGVCETVVDGETGMLFEPLDIEAHAAALLQMSMNPNLRQRFGQAGWKRVRDNFSIEREASQLRKMFGLNPAGNVDQN